MNARARLTSLHILVWLALSMITASQGILTYLATGGEVHVFPVVLLNLALWLPWLLLSPLVFAAARRWPLYGEGWPRHVAAHLLLNLALGFIAAVLYRVLRIAIGMPVRSNYALLLATSLNTSLLVYWALVASAHAVAYYRRVEERKRQTAELDRQLSQARLDALRAQIHPHFLFNTLHAIAARIRTDARGAEDMLGVLGDLLRVNLHTAPANELPLRQELDLIQRYVAIQQIRFGDRLHVETQIEPGALDVAVPVLVLQPLVENAIEHGIAQRLSGGTVRIEAKLDGTVLRLTVSNDGEGDTDAAGDESRWQVGLRNTRDRLRTMYGEQQTLSVAREAGGVAVRIAIPARRGDAG